jgi:phosphate-selective porin
LPDLRKLASLGEAKDNRHKRDKTWHAARRRRRQAEETFMSQVMGKAWCGVILIAAIFVSLAPAHATDKSLLDALRQKGVLTQQEYERLKGTELTPAQRTGLIDVLRAKGVLTKGEAAKLESGAPTAPAAPAAAVVAQAAEKPAITSPQVGYDEGFFLRTQDGNFVMRFNGRIAEDFLFSEPDTSQPSDTETIDRARLVADVTVYKYFRMKLENEFSSGAFSGSSGLRDAFIAVTPMSELNLQAGQYPVPVSYESIVSKKYTNFVERAAVVSSTFNPRRDIGVMAYGQFANKLVQYQLAGMNGAGQNRADNNSDKDLVAHLVVAPFVNEGPEHLRGFNVGSGVTWGHQPSETVSSGKSTTSSITGQTETFFTFFPAVTRHGDRLRWGSHAAWLDGPFSVVSEYIQTEEARDGLGNKGGDLPRLYTDGAYADFTWLITGETKPYNARMRPARPLWDLKNPGPGAWEAALRYEYYKLRHGTGVGADGKTDAELYNRYDAFVAGINWYPNEFLRFSVNYLYGNFAHRGTGKSPNPAQHSNNAVLCRAQLEF